MKLHSKSVHTEFRGLFSYVFIVSPFLKMKEKTPIILRKVSLLSCQSWILQNHILDFVLDSNLILANAVNMLFADMKVD